MPEALTDREKKYVELIASMTVDALMHQLDKATYISNLRLIANEMERLDDGQPNIT